MNWQIYIIHCSDDSLYTGITTDIPRRFEQHATGKGAKYFRGRRPLAVVYREEGRRRSSASTREREIKRLDRPGKLALIVSASTTVAISDTEDTCSGSIVGHHHLAMPGNKRDVA